LGSALAFVLMALVLLLLKVYLRADRRITLQQVSQ
jgi:hypothetical protein